MKLNMTVSAATLIACWLEHESALAQSAINIRGTELLGEFSTLNNTVAGRSLLDQNIRLGVQINNQADAASRARAVYDAVGSDWSFSEALGSRMSAIYKARNDKAGTFYLSQNIKDLLNFGTGTAGGNSGVIKYIFSNGTIDGKTPISAAALAALPPGAQFDVLGKAYGLPAGAPGGDKYGNPRLFQGARGEYGSIQGWEAVDFFGNKVNSFSYLVGPASDTRNSPSFPSGHTVAGYAFSLLFASMVPERYKEALTQASEFGNSRIVLGAHYPLDVIAGRILATHDLAHLLANDPDYVGTRAGLSILDFQAQLATASVDLRTALSADCGSSIQACAASAANATSDRFADKAKNKADYNYRLTYGMPGTSATNGTLLAITDPAAQALLATRFPYLTPEQRTDVLFTTQVVGGVPFDSGKLGFWARLNLYAAADGYGAFNGPVTVTMDAAKGGFSAFDSFANDIGGTGSLTKLGTGTLALTGTNTYSGGTTIAGGTLIAVGGAALPNAGMLAIDKTGRLALLSDETIGGLSGSGSVALGTSWLSAGADGSSSLFAGTISGLGGLAKLGAGTLTLSGRNDYLGGTEIAAGTLAVSGVQALPDAGRVTIGKTGRLALLSDATVSGLSGSGSVDLGASRLSVGADDQSSTYDGSISGHGGLTKLGAGQLNLTGANTFAGDTRVTGGLLSVNGSLASGVMVASGATLGGNGRIASLDVASGGTLAPGNSVGTLNVTGNVRFAPGGVYRVEVAPDGRMDSLLVGGGVDLNGASLELRKENTSGWLSPGKAGGLLGSHSTILSAAGGVTGRLGPVVNSGFTFIDADLAYSAGAVDLSLKRNGVHFASFASSESGRSVATALDGMTPGTPIYETVLANSAPSALPPLFDQLSGQIHAGMAASLLEDSRFLRTQALDRAGAGIDGAPSGNTAILARDVSGASIVYMHGFRSWGRSDGQDGNAASDRSADGFLAGADGVLDNDWRIGGLVAYGHTGLSLADGLGSGHADSYALGLYAGRRFENGLTLRVGAGYSHSEIKTTRTLFTPGIVDGSLSAKYGADLGQIFGETGWRFGSDEALIEPFANITYVALHDGGFTEDGGSVALRSGGFANDLLLSTLGVRLTKAFDLPGSTVTARSTLGWRHAYGSATPDASLSFAAGSPTFAAAGTPIARDAFVVELGASTGINGNLSVDVAYQGWFAATGVENGFKAGLSWKF
ncbi:autotransporter domain-containing protein [Herbaspirillum camelliae]|uniref:autotransporter domain-containing protein n=1 Tax=Herbaspirillum camelliae TaxID=1892903 RepID=UPI000AF013FA|nr:autotransporter domain-containing protein [Herbaspirillum camelliae]